MGLDARGDVAVLEIVLYAPILVLSFMLALRHGFRRREGWISLFILSIFRIVGGILHVVAETQSHPSLGVIVGYSVMEAIGLGPLLVATLGISRSIAQSTVDQTPLLPTRTGILGVISGLAIILTVIGGIKEGGAHDTGALTDGMNYRRAGSILFLILYVALIAVNVFLWSQRSRIQSSRLTLLTGVSAALPFVFVRVLYNVLGVMAPLTLVTTDGRPELSTGSSPLAKFSIFTGPWGIYFGMSVLMEYIAILIYVAVGLKTPAQTKTSSVAMQQPVPVQAWQQPAPAPPVENWDAESQASTYKGEMYKGETYKGEDGYANAYAPPSY